MAGLMNTVNSAGYLVGAYAASTVIRRFGMLATVKYCTAICIVTLALSAVTENAVAFGFPRLVSGIAGVVACMIHTITRRDGTQQTKPLWHGRSA